MNCLIASDSRGFKLEPAIVELADYTNLKIPIYFTNISGANIATLTEHLVDYPGFADFDLVLFNAGVNNLSTRGRNGMVSHRFIDPEQMFSSVTSEAVRACQVLRKLNPNVVFCQICGLDVDAYNASKGRFPSSLESQSTLDSTIPNINHFLQELNGEIGTAAPWRSEEHTSELQSP